MKEDNNRLISLKEASKMTPYSSEYLGLLVRKGKIEGQKLGGKWMTTPNAVDFYLKKAAESSYEHQQNLNVKIPAEEIKKATTNFRWVMILLIGIILTGLITWKIMDDKKNENIRAKYRLVEDSSGNITIYADNPDEVKSVKVVPK
jgi:hypothetical protein